MKAKALLILNIFLLLSLLVSFAIYSGVQAQERFSAPSISGIHPTSLVSPLLSPVSFAEDPLRQHAVQIRSYFKTVGTGVVIFDTVPAEKIFVVTDIRVNDETTLTLSSGLETKMAMSFDLDHGFNFRLNSGIVFEPFETIQIQSSYFTKVLISGYYADL